MLKKRAVVGGRISLDLSDSWGQCLESKANKEQIKWTTAYPQGSTHSVSNFMFLIRFSI